jgi:hypothetical protein
MKQRRENGLPIHQDKPDIAAAAAVVEVLAAADIHQPENQRQ